MTDAAAMPKLGIDLGRCNPAAWPELAQAADELGYESIWIPEHLIFPATIDVGPDGSDGHIEVDPKTPTFDPFVMLASLAALTSRVRLGTHVYNVGLRHPIITARAVATLDVISAGRVLFGVGASWLKGEWDAMQLDFAGRGSRVDECIEVCKRLWSEPVVTHVGDHFQFGPVVFEPKPVQQPVPIHVGGESRRALARAARVGSGWISMLHDLDGFRRASVELDDLAMADGKAPESIERTALVAGARRVDIELWQGVVTRLIVAPWQRSRDAVEGAARLANDVGLSPE